MARPALLRHEGDGRWRMLTDNDGAAPVEAHLAVLFRDPPVRSGRSIERVLDLRERTDAFTACATCWVRALLEVLGPLPPGLTLALDNGVRCGWEAALGWDADDDPALEEYLPWARCCLERTRGWVSSLLHPNGAGRRPGIVIADSLLAEALANLGVLTRRDGSAWTAAADEADHVGNELRAFDRDALLLPHPRRVRPGVGEDPLSDAIRRAVPKALALAHIAVP